MDNHGDITRLTDAVILERHFPAARWIILHDRLNVVWIVEGEAADGREEIAVGCRPLMNAFNLRDAIGPK